MTKKLEGKPLPKVVEGMVRVEVLKDYEGHKKGEKLTVPERKVRDSSRLLRKGYIKPTK